MSFIPEDPIDVNDPLRPTMMKFTVEGFHDTPGQYHGTIHKEQDGSCHVIANSGVRKKQGIRKGFWNGIQDYDYGKNNKYQNEVDFAYHHFCENDDYNPKTGGRSKRIRKKTKTKKRRPK